MGHYCRVGQVPPKRHMQFRTPDGGLYAEELMGAEGFSSDASLLYHRGLPTAIVASEAVEVPADATKLTPNHPLKPRHFKTHGLEVGGDLVSGRQLLLGNDDVRILYAVADSPSELYRNAIGDECVYVEAGSARFESVYGGLDISAGDYVVIPTSTTHRWVPTGDEPVRALVFEASAHIRPPRRYLSATGQFLESAPYSERDLRAPSEPLLVAGDDVPVLVRHRAGLTRMTYLQHPFDVVGWDGCLYPFAFSIHAFEPRVGRFHMPPPTHQTFEGPNFVICSFCPRPFDFDPRAIAVPYNHANVDSDEMLFYVGGDFMSRKGAGIGLGSISLHPSGFTHGPQPGSVEAAIGKPGTDELAVMIDTFRPLHLGPAARQSEDADYAWTWAKGSATKHDAGPGLSA
ncbi:MAG: cupin domain-containing protein [Candidatus Dormiibacterota bacterium]